MNRLIGQNWDSAVARVLRVKFELGLFENPYTDLKAAADTSFMAQHGQLARQAAAKSIVLLKNDAKKVLPLKKGLKKIAIIGVDAVEARLGGYSGPGNIKTNLVDAMKKMPGAVVSYAEGCGRSHSEWNVVKAEYLFTNKTPGIKAEYFYNTTLRGNPAVVRTDASINFQWTLYSPDPAINFDFFSVRWTGMIARRRQAVLKLVSMEMMVTNYFLMIVC